jgi:hypothetical protein
LPLGLTLTPPRQAFMAAHPQHAWSMRQPSAHAPAQVTRRPATQAPEPTAPASKHPNVAAPSAAPHSPSKHQPYAHSILSVMLIISPSRTVRLHHVTRACKLCGETFEPVVGRQGGRPRQHCYDCVPAGYRAVQLPHRTKLRRVTPLMPRTPKGGLAQVYQIAPRVTEDQAG